MEGRSLRPAFVGSSINRTEPIYWEHEGNRAVHRGNWKLVSRFPGEWELYDLEADRTEMNNLAGREPKRVQQMAALYDRWAARANVEPMGRGPESPTHAGSDSFSVRLPEPVSLRADEIRACHQD